MKLTNKFLTALAPVAMVGVLTPTLVACNKGPSYSIHYGQEINCLDSQEADYQSVETIANAIKPLVNDAPAGQSSLSDVNATLARMDGFQNVYYEIIANYTRIQTRGLRIINYDGNFETQTISFTYFDNEYPEGVDVSGAPAYDAVDGKFILQILQIGATFQIDSYTYRNVTPK